MSTAIKLMDAETASMRGLNSISTRCCPGAMAKPRKAALVISIGTARPLTRARHPGL
jgi:hypothetical protein